MKTSEYTPESTYFEEREGRLVREIEDAKAKIDAAQTAFAKRSEDLTRRKEEILDKTADLRALRVDLAARTERARTSIAELGALTVQCETLAGELDSLLKDDLVTVAALESEIAGIEVEETKKIRRPAKDVVKLETRLAHLRLRKAFAERHPNPRPEKVALVEDNKEAEDGQVG